MVETVLYIAMGAIGLVAVGMMALVRFYGTALMLLAGLGLFLWSNLTLDQAQAEEGKLATVARFVVTESDGFTSIVTDRETGCNYSERASGWRGSRTPVLRPDGTPDCSSSRIVPGLAAKRAQVAAEIEAERGEQAWW